MNKYNKKMMHERELIYDAKGQLHRADKKYKAGDILEFLVNDKSAPDDFQVFCDTKKFKLLSINRDKNITIKIKI